MKKKKKSESLGNITADEFNELYGLDSSFRYNGRTVFTRSRAYTSLGQHMVKIHYRASAVLLSDLRLI